MPFKKLRAQYLILFVIGVFFNFTSFYGSAKINIDAPDASGKTALHKAVIDGDEAKVLELIHQGANINAQDFNKYTPLHYAVRHHERKNIVKILLRNHAQVNIWNHKDKTPLHIATEKNYKTFPKLLKQHGADFKFHFPDDTGKTALHHAVIKGDETLVLKLINQGANVRASDLDNNTPLHYAVTSGLENIVKILLDHKAPINAINNEGETSLHIATQKENKTISDLLKQHGANFEFYLPDESGKAALHRAVLNGDEAQVLKLVEQGATINDKDLDQCTPLQYAVDLNQENIVKILLEHHADADTRDINKTSPAHTAAQKGLIKIARLLKQYGADFNAQDDQGNTPLIFATNNQDTKMVRFIVGKLSDIAESARIVNTRNFEGNTALHFAAGANKNANMYQIALTLIKFGANIHVFNNISVAQTPLYLAAQAQNLVLLKDLLAIDIAARKKAKHEIYDNATPLHHAASDTNSPQILQTILQCLYDNFSPEIIKYYINLQDSSGNTALHYAADRQSIEQSAELLKYGADPNIQDSKQETPLHYAALDQNYALEEILIDYGAKIDTTNNTGQTPFMIATNNFGSLQEQWDQALATRNDSTLRYLTHYIDNSAILNRANSKGESALHIAAHKNNNMLTHLLLQKKADVKIQDNNKQTPLHIAADLHYATEPNHYDLETLLIDHGAPIDISDNFGRTPLQIIINRFGQLNTQWDYALNTQNYDDLFYLAHYSDDSTILDTINSHGETALHIAAKKNNINLARLLLQKKANVQAQDNNKKTPLHLAATDHAYELEELFIDYGAKIDVADSTGQTPFMIATNHLGPLKIQWDQALVDQNDPGLLYLAHYLDFKNQSINAPNSNGQTALHIAALKQNKPLINFLIQHGALNLPDNQSKRPTDQTVLKEIKDLITDQLLKKQLPKTLFGFAQEKLYKTYQLDPSSSTLDDIGITNPHTEEKVTLPPSVATKVQDSFAKIGLLPIHAISPHQRDNSNDRAKALAIMQGKQKSKL